MVLKLESRFWYEIVCVRQAPSENNIFIGPTTKIKVRTIVGNTVPITFPFLVLITQAFHIKVDGVPINSPK